MRLLLDTHLLLWALAEPDRLDDATRWTLEDPGNEVMFSAASLWEIAIKVGLGKLTLTEPFATLIPRELEANAMTLLPVRVEHLARLIELPFRHRDPFDRLLAAQALVDDFTVVSKDGVLDAYGVRRVW